MSDSAAASTGAAAAAEAAAEAAAAASPPHRPPADVDRFVRARILRGGAPSAADAADANAPAPPTTTTPPPPPPLPATAIYITGGGAQALAWLLATPGASRLVVDAAVPYSREATADLLLLRGRGGGSAAAAAPSSSSSPSPSSSSIDALTSVTAATAARLAEAAYRRAAQLTPPGRPCVGLGATSALASEPPKRGAHRAHVAARWGAGATAAATLELAKGARTRWEEDGVAARLVLRVLERAVREASGEAAGEGQEETQAAPPLDLRLLLAPAQEPPGGSAAAARPRDVLTESAVLRPFAAAAFGESAEPSAAAAAAAASTSSSSAAAAPRDGEEAPKEQQQQREREERRAALAALLQGKARCVEFSADGRVCAVDAPRGGGSAVSGASPPVVYLSGSFNPLHAGHEGLLLAARRAAEAALLQLPRPEEAAAAGGVEGGDGAAAAAAAATAAAAEGAPSSPSPPPPPPCVPGVFELSIGNADKGRLPLDEAERRAAQFARRGLPLLVTVGVPLFTQKAALIPGAWFAVGHDTAARLVQPRYYDDGGGDDGGRGQMALQFERLRAAGCRFLVAGRAEVAARGEAAARRFLTLADVPVPRGLAELFVDIPEAAFRNDVSSTELRRAKGGTV